MRLAAVALMAGAGTVSAQSAQAQSRFSPAVRVDGEVISTWELDQRATFLTLLRAPGDVRALARDQLINEALQMRTAKAAGVTASEDEIKAGMDEFAARGSLSTDQLLQVLAQAGIDAQSFRAFVKAGVTWRDYLRQTIAPNVTVSEAEIDGAMAEAVAPAGRRVLLSEIVLPAGDPATRRASQQRAARLTGLDEKAFQDAALRFSAGKSRNNGGKMNWLDPATLPPNVAAAVRGLRPGQTTRPLPVENTIRLYYMRDRDEVKATKPVTEVEYAALQLPGGASRANLDAAEKIRARATSCDNLYPFARALEPEQLVRERVAESRLPAAYRAEIAKLDPGEISTALTSPTGAMVVLMVCARGNAVPRSLTRGAVEQKLKNKRITTLGQNALAEQRANAHIEILSN